MFAHAGTGHNGIRGAHCWVAHGCSKGHAGRMGRRFGLWAGLAALAFIGCGTSHGSTAGDDAGVSGDDAGVPGSQTMSLAVTYTDIPVGQERILCQILDLGNDEPAMVRSMRTTLTTATHHMIVERTDDPLTTEPYPCGQIPGGPDTLFIAQEAESEVTYPDGAGLPVEAHQHIYVELHYINYLSSTTDVKGTVDFDLVPPDPTVDPVSIMFTGPLSLDIPGHSTDVVVDTFQTVPQGARIFALTSHMHHLGTLATIKRATSVGDPDAVLLHESTEWERPPLDTFEPPLVLDPGEGLWLTCHYDNPSSDPVGFGISFYNEMCFLWVYWY